MIREEWADRIARAVVVAVKTAIEEEREACAKVADAYAATTADEGAAAAKTIAAKIRKRTD